ncbi:uncharacterized protein BO87DRAFT_462486 [Aspergillus neoniger CBS 115656]|uniref:F-box domain-containing protein n=1 Tax=Aspergillus neoniger (strain CBS 115656) TaxID=1448310 RepID=A0A318Y8E9_ASPNB|nr:hypothetical protein BO87DRAFT_462486 [Aspergillus neoniger CBS 115656]PYH30219.1 hypothetical protein BO87DRAFT_462486 [Aspergillus neoniger CBS 115656]
MNLPNLPQEILLLIITELRYANKFGAIAKLCQTCKTVCALVQPELFRQGPQWLIWSDGRVPPYKVDMVTLMRFIEAVVERPELGTFVRKLDMDILFFPRFDSLQNLPFGPRKVSMETLMRAYNHFPADWKQRHLTGNAGIHPLPLFMLLISLTPNLQELGLSYIETGLGGLELLWERDSQGIRRYDYLPNLKKLVIVLEAMSHESLRNLIHLMHLPTLNELSICGADEHDPGCPPFNLLQPESLSITMLDLGASTFTPPPLLRQIVRACKCLKVFCISEAVIDRKCRHASRVKRSNILSILEAHKYSLLKLELNYNECAPNPGDPDWSHYGSFTSFISLKVLQVEQSGLRDVPDLPNSLESLRIVECDRPVYMFLASLLSKSKSDRLSLKYVRISEKWEYHCRDQNWILGIKPTYELDKTAEGKAAMMEACRRLDNLIKKADFSVEVFDCSAWDRYVAEQKTTNGGVVVDNTA